MIKTIRCAIYTRKSDADGLEQDFNSLDAQREACAAYILSQKHEGWTLVPDFYDDGGFSGGNMHRPGLKQLLDDVRSAKVNVIVVYKVDRLTRSLADFARIVDVLDGAGASFVSVTQSFNTTTSMGRLTLNVLLSFAQFEREVTGERIRDKIAASKRKGMWMGGNPPLGYDVKDRQLVINDAEAETVRHIMRRYLAAGSVRALQEELNTQSIVTKCGKGRGGVPFTRGSLGHLLRNPIYLGEIHFKGQVYPGQHKAIVERALWDQVQAAFASQTVERKHGSRAAEPSLLNGVIFDPDGGRMTPSHAVKNGQRYRYYVTLADHRKPGSGACRISGPVIEQAVIERLAQWLRHYAPERHVTDADEIAEAMFMARREAEVLETGTPAEKRATLLMHVVRVELGQQCFAVVLKHMPDGQPEKLTASLAQVRMGNDRKVIIGSANPARTVIRDEQLVQTLADARAAQRLALRYPDLSLAELAGRAARSAGRFKQLLRLSYLSPHIVGSIVAAEEPSASNRASLHSVANIPIIWREQEEALAA